MLYRCASAHFIPSFLSKQQDGFSRSSWSSYCLVPWAPTSACRSASSGVGWAYPWISHLLLLWDMLLILFDLLLEELHVREVLLGDVLEGRWLWISCCDLGFTQHGDCLSFDGLHLYNTMVVHTFQIVGITLYKIRTSRSCWLAIRYHSPLLDFTQPNVSGFVVIAFHFLSWIKDRLIHLMETVD